jgi:ABC-2 type transport system permease protein
MKKFIAIYTRLLTINAAALVAYRMNMINSIIGSGVWGAFSIITVLLLTSKTTAVLGWSQADFMVLAAVQSIFVGIFDFFFSRNIERFPRYVELGQLDSFLLKPIAARVLISSLYINYGSLIRLLIGMLFLSYLLTTLHIPVSNMQVLFFIFALCVGIILLYSLCFLLVTITIWFTRLSNIIELLYTLRGASRFPLAIFKEVSVLLFIIFFPLTVIVTRPTEFLLAKTSYENIIPMSVVALMLFLLSQLFWKFALRSYTSASS